MEGNVHMYRKSNPSEILHTHAANECFGKQEFLSNRRRNLTCMAAGYCIVLKIKSSDFIKVLIEMDEYDVVKKMT